MLNGRAVTKTVFLMKVFTVDPFGKVWFISAWKKKRTEEKVEKEEERIGKGILCEKS